MLLPGFVTTAVEYVPEAHAWESGESVTEIVTLVVRACPKASEGMRNAMRSRRFFFTGAASS